MSKSKTPPFPVTIKHETFQVHDILTDILCVGFENDILLIITQVGKIGSLMRVVLDTPVGSLFGPNFFDFEEDDVRLTSEDFVKLKLERHPVASKFLLGAQSGTTNSLVYEIIASQVLNKIIDENPKEKRSLLLGLALDPVILKSSEGSLNSSSKLSETIKCLPQLVSYCRNW